MSNSSLTDVQTKSQIIAELNDQFRSGQSGQGQIMITAGIQSLGGDAMLAIHQAVASFNTFTEDNDPHAEHDFGSLTYQDNTIFWKLDYYAPDMLHGSEDPSDPARTVRVLTIMLASEY